MALTLKILALTYLLTWFSLFSTGWLLRLLLSRLKPSPIDSGAIAASMAVSGLLGLAAGIGVSWAVVTGRLAMETGYFTFLMYELSRAVMFLGTAGFLYSLILLFRLWLRGRGKQAYENQAGRAEEYRGVLVYYTDRVEVPGLRGIWTPVILFPRKLAKRLPREDIELMLEHEVLHHRRSDNLKLVILEALGAFALNLAGAAKLIARYRLSAELAIDASLVSTVPASRYIACLLHRGDLESVETSLDEYTRVRLQAIVDGVPAAGAALRTVLSLAAAITPMVVVLSLLAIQAFRCFFPCFLGY